MLTHSSVQKCWITNNDDLIVATNRRRSYSSSEDSMLEFILKKNCELSKECVENWFIISEIRENTKNAIQTTKG